MIYVFGVSASDEHDEEIASFEAPSLGEAKQMFAEAHPHDVKRVTCITSDNGYEEIF